MHNEGKDGGTGNAHEIQKRIAQLEEEVQRLREIIRDITSGLPQLDIENRPK